MSIRKRNTAWFANKNNTSSEEEEEMVSFPDIESMTLERFYQSYMNSKGDKKFRKVNLGVWTVDLLKNIKFLTLDPQNTEKHFIVVRGQTHHRRRSDTSRFVAGRKNDPFIRRKITGDEDYCWLGLTWVLKFNYGQFPSLKQIELGLIAEA